MAWKMLGIDNRWPAWGKWEAWWKKNDLKAVSRDVWLVLLAFIDKHGKDISNYSEDGMCLLCPLMPLRITLKR